MTIKPFRFNSQTSSFCKL